jgi:hypothetical protein
VVSADDPGVPASAIGVDIRAGRLEVELRWLAGKGVNLIRSIRFEGEHSLVVVADALDEAG